MLRLVVVGLGVALGLFYGSGWFDWFVGCVLLLCWFVGFGCWLWFLDLRWFSGVVCLCLIWWFDLWCGDCGVVILRADFLVFLVSLVLLFCVGLV